MKNLGVIIDISHFLTLSNLAGWLAVSSKHIISKSKLFILFPLLLQWPPKGAPYFYSFSPQSVLSVAARGPVTALVKILQWRLHFIQKAKSSQWPLGHITYDFTSSHPLPPPLPLPPGLNAVPAYFSMLPPWGCFLKFCLGSSSPIVCMANTHFLQNFTYSVRPLLILLPQPTSPSLPALRHLLTLPCLFFPPPP